MCRIKSGRRFFILTYRVCYMDQILTVRSNIYDQFHGSNAGSEHFFKPKHAAAYAAYYTAMYLIQDTGESVQLHMQRGFSSDPLRAYIEFWGVMQAIFIQQDAIRELYKAVIGSSLNILTSSDWSKLRDVRNLCAGHPANRTQGVPATQRSFMGRGFGSYNQIRYELWDARMPQQPSHPRFNLRAMIKAYDVEGAQALKMVLSALATKWPRNVSSSAVGAPPTASVAAGAGPGVHIVIRGILPSGDLRITHHGRS
jgi:hypothetical protein